MKPASPNMEPWNRRRVPRPGLRPCPLPGESDRWMGSPERKYESPPPTWASLWFIRNGPQSEHPQEGTVLVLLFMTACHLITQASVSPAVNGG